MKAIQGVSDILNIDTLQYIQDNFAKSMALAFVTVDYKGRPITRPSGFTTFCSQGRENVAFKEMCFQCDAHGGLHSAITGQPYVYRCHADLVDFAVPLILEGSYVGAVLGGQVKLPDEEINQLEYLIPRQMDWQRDPVLREAHDQIKVTSYSKVEASVILLRDMIQHLLEEEYKKLITQEVTQDEELKAERAQRQSLEKAIQRNDTSVLRNQVGFDFVFYVLNVASKLAYQEKAPRTEAVIYDFADMMRYAMSNSDSHIVTLAEELDYIERFLHIKKAQLGDLLSYEFNVPEEYRSVVCPFMLLQPLVENAMKYTVEPRPEGGSITIQGTADGEDLLLSVRDNGDGMTQELIDAILDAQGYRPDTEGGKMSLHNMNRKLKGLFGRRYGLEIRSLLDGVEGTEILIRLPLSSRDVMM